MYAYPPIRRANRAAPAKIDSPPTTKRAIDSVDRAGRAGWAAQDVEDRQQSPPGRRWISLVGGAAGGWQRAVARIGLLA